MPSYSRVRSRSRPYGEETISPWWAGSAPYQETMKDFNDRKGQNNECSHQSTIVVHDSGVLSVSPRPPYYGPTSYSWNSVRLWANQVIDGPILPPEVYPDVLGRCYTECADNIRNAGRSDFHAISFLREIGETVKALRNPFQLVTWVHKTLGPRPRKGSFKKALKKAHAVSARKSGRRVASAASNTWLEGTYGWLPFVSDVLALADVVGGAVQQRRALASQGRVPFRFQHSASIASLISWRFSGQRPCGITGGACTGHESVTMYGTYVINPSVAAESFLTSCAKAVNIDRVGYALWDAVPYSFVLDWFLPLGELVDNMLQGPPFYSSASDIWYAKQRSLRVNVQWGTSDEGRYDPYLLYRGGGNYVELQKTFERHPADFSLVTTTSPSTGMHGTRIASGIALAWGQFPMSKGIR